MYDCDLTKIVQIHIDAMRLVTSATARCNIVELYTESGWQSISTRLDNAKLLLLFKIQNNLATDYLIALLPPRNQEMSSYNLRNREDFRIPYSRTNTLFNSFFPSTLRLWNNLSERAKSCSTVPLFKQMLSVDVEKPILYYYGDRWACIHHARIRIGCSKLNFD